MVVQMTSGDMVSLVLLVSVALALVAGLLGLIACEEKPTPEERRLPDFDLETERLFQPIPVIRR